MTMQLKLINWFWDQEQLENKFFMGPWTTLESSESRTMIIKPEFTFYGLMLCISLTANLNSHLKNPKTFGQDYSSAAIMVEHCPGAQVKSKVLIENSWRAEPTKQTTFIIVLFIIPQMCLNVVFKVVNLKPVSPQARHKILFRI